MLKMSFNILTILISLAILSCESDNNFASSPTYRTTPMPTYYPGDYTVEGTNDSSLPVDEYYGSQPKFNPADSYPPRIPRQRYNNNSSQNYNRQSNYNQYNNYSRPPVYNGRYTNSNGYYQGSQYQQPSRYYSNPYEIPSREDYDQYYSPPVGSYGIGQDNRSLNTVTDRFVR